MRIAKCRSKNTVYVSCPGGVDAVRDSQAWQRAWPLAPCVGRPGELSARLEIYVSEKTADRVRVAARAARVPGTVWLRLSVEAARQIAVAEALLAEPRQRLTERLDDAASECPRVTALEQAPLFAYARALRGGTRNSTPGIRAGMIALAVPEEWAAAWRETARRDDVELGDWVEAHADAAPAGALR